ncbi:hypothetical protein [Pedobacter sp. GR22-6]|uniref:hypothetical protein n=1 Tax=Pedobacter sp. GR22-6 TaxID=3127957 RepID=UPI00307D950A
MSDSFNLFTLIVLLGCLLLGVGLAWLLYQRGQHLEPRLRYGLAIVRATVISLMAMLLFFPLVRNVSYNLEKPIIVIGQDNSLSVGNIMPEGFNPKQYEKDLKQLAERLSAKYEVKTYHFSDSVGTGFDFNNQGKLSNGVRFINQLNDEMLNRNVGAVILASDGIFNRGGSPVYELNKLKAPVYTIALGDTLPKKDLMIANINHNSLVYLDNDFTIEVQLQAFEAKGTESTLSVIQDGKILHSEKVSLVSDAFAKSFPIKLKANKLGLQKYTVQLSTIPNEISEKNNVQQLFIDVIDARQKVLIAAAGPHPDITALRQALQLNPHYDAKVLLGDELNVVNPNDYGLVVLYQLPAAQNDAQVFLNKLKQSIVPVWYILGAQSSLSSFNQQQNEVNYSGGSQTLQEAFAEVDPNFTAFHLDPGAANVMSSFDPLESPFGRIEVRADAMVVLRQRIGKLKTNSPQLFFLNSNGRKSGYLIGEGIWRWKLSEAQSEQNTEVFNTLVTSSVQYLSVKDDKRKFKVYTAKTTFDENENVMINAILYNDSYVAVNTADVSLQIRNAAGKSYNYLFSKTDSGYQLDAGALPAGQYRYIANTTLGSKKYTAQGIFYVNALIAEYQQTTANHQLLHQLSVSTNGKSYLPASLLKIAADIENSEEIKTLSYEDRKYEELINFKWLFALFMALLSVEWFLRKRNGEI